MTLPVTAATVTAAAIPPAPWPAVVRRGCPAFSIVELWRVLLPVPTATALPLTLLMLTGCGEAALSSGFLRIGTGHLLDGTGAEGGFRRTGRG
jgi:hypothetical protein